MSLEIFGRVMLFALTLVAAIPSSAQEPPPAEPEGYRLDNYHARTPATLKGATVIDTEQAFEIWTKKEAVFVDTLSRPSRPTELPKDAPWQPPSRRDIPGSAWLPGTGLGELTPAFSRYFEQGLARATMKDKSKPLVFYCRANCWASWNAAKRALTLGYTEVSWYPGGADGWENAGHPLEERQPEPFE
ncbi:MAG: PQQ-dependent catabolism-associated CXXCW motif protein [Methylocystis sp.]